MPIYGVISLQLYNIWLFRKSFRIQLYGLFTRRWQWWSTAALTCVQGPYNSFRTRQTSVWMKSKYSNTGFAFLISNLFQLLLFIVKKVFFSSHFWLKLLSLHFLKMSKYNHTAILENRILFKKRAANTIE